MHLEVSESAKRDLKAIYEYSVQRWGKVQADRYLAELFRSADQLKSMPTLGSKHGQLRKLVCGRHLIFY